MNRSSILASPGTSRATEAALGQGALIRTALNVLPSYWGESWSACRGDGHRHRVLTRPSTLRPSAPRELGSFARQGLAASRNFIHNEGSRPPAIRLFPSKRLV